MEKASENYKNNIEPNLKRSHPPDKPKKEKIKKSVKGTILESFTHNIKVYSRLADKLPACSKIWWIIRSLDKRGLGTVVLTQKDLKRISKYLDCSIQTVRRHIQQSFNCGLIQFYKRLRKQDNKIVIRYASINRVCYELGLDDVGITVWCDRKQMQVLKPSVTTAELKTKQDQSFYAAQEENNKKEKPKKVRGARSILKPNKCKTNPAYHGRTSNRSNGEKGYHYKGSRFVVVNPNEFMLFGASQLSIADDLNRSGRTIQRRTQNLERKQLAVATTIRPDELDFMNAIDFDGNKPFLKYRNHAIEPQCNIYRFKGVETSSAYKVNGRIRKWIKNKKLKQQYSIEERHNR